MVWENVERPGQTGFRKQEILAERNEKYGEGNWRIFWRWNEIYLDKLTAFHICEDAYFNDSLQRPDVWKRLLDEAKDVYDVKPEEVDSGTDYGVQLGYTRFHDICIRRVLMRRGWRFHGREIVQIRYDKESPNWYSENFDPGKVRFHMPELIVKPSLESWWDEDSVEDFYQSNKVLQAKK